MHKDKIKLIFLAILTITVLLTVALYGFKMAIKQELNPGNLIALIIPLIIMGFMAFLIFRRYKDIKTGLVVEDERSKKVMTKAAAQSFYISLYWLLIISWLEPFFAKIANLDRLDASQAISGGIGGMAIIFFISWFYNNKKGELI